MADADEGHQERMVGGGAVHGFAGVLQQDFGILAGGERVHLVQAAKQEVQGREQMAEGDGECVYAVFLKLGVAVAGNGGASAGGVAALNGAGEHPPCGRVVQ